MKTIIFFIILFNTGICNSQTKKDNMLMYEQAFAKINNSSKTLSYIEKYDIKNTSKIYISSILFNTSEIDIYLDTIISLKYKNLSKNAKLSLRNKMLDSIYKAEKNISQYDSNYFFMPLRNENNITSELKLVFGKYNNGYLTASLYIKNNCKTDSIECYINESKAFIKYLFIFNENKEVEDFIEYQGTF